MGKHETRTCSDGTLEPNTSQISKTEESEFSSFPNTAGGEHPISKVVSNYLLAIKNVARTASIVIPHVHRWLDEEHKKNRKNISKYLALDEADNIPDEMANSGMKCNFE